MSMTKDDIRARITATANPRPTLVTDIPEWGDIYVKPSLVGDIDEVAEGIDQRTRIAIGIAKSICNAEGELVFDQKNPEDLAVLKSLPTHLIARLNKAVEAQNVSTEERAKELGNVSPPATDSSST